MDVFGREQREILDAFLKRYPVMKACEESLRNAYVLAATAYCNGGKLLVAGNGGSSADAEHIVGELMKGFCRKRPVPEDVRQALMTADPELGAELATHLQGALPAVSLNSHPALTTAFQNDRHPKMAIAQQVYGWGRPGDIFLGISTSGNSENIVFAAATAKALGMQVIALTGQNPSKLSDRADVCVQVPETKTEYVQELHLPVYHCLCLMLESYFFAE